MYIDSEQLQSLVKTQSEQNHVNFLTYKIYDFLAFILLIN